MGAITEPASLAFFVAALIGGGLAAGFLAGLLGVGGGAVLVPILYEVFRQAGVDETVRMHMTLGTSLAIIVPTALVSARGHLKKGALDMGVVRRLGPWVVLGVCAGVAIAEGAGSAGLKWVWIVAGSLMASKMALGRQSWRLGDSLPSGPGLEVTAFAIGLVSALMSIGGGMFMVSLLTLYGVPIHAAVATSSGFGPIIAVPGTAGYIWAGLGVADRPPYSLGYVNLLALLLVAPASMLAAPWGVRTAHGIARRRLEQVFALFLALVVLKFLWSLAR